MQSLLELSDILGASFLPLDPEKKNHRLARQLADYIREAEVPTEAGAAAAIGVKVGGTTYRKVKHVLKYAYINGITAVYSHDRNSPDRQKIYEYAWKHLSIGMSYRLRPQTSLVVPYLKEALKVAEEHDIPEVAALAARYLAHQYANKKFDKKLYNDYSDRAANHEKNSIALTYAINSASHMTFMRNSAYNGQEILDFAQSCHKYINTELAHIQHSRVRFFGFYILMTGYIGASKFVNAIEVGKDALAFLAKNGNTPQLAQLIEANMALAYMQTEKYEEGIIFAKRLAEKTSISSYNYIKAYELMIFLGFRSGKYQEAFSYIQEAKSASIHNRLKSIFRETFDILEAFAYVTVELNLLTDHTAVDIFSGFRINKFLNSFDHADKEKSNRNIQILVIKLIHYIMNHKHGKIYDMVEATEKYVQRHLKGKEHKRSKLFIKALLQIPRSAFHKTGVLRNSQKYVDQMKLVPLRNSGQRSTLEIIPYEVLWESILSSLGNRRVEKRKR